MFRNIISHMINTRVFPLGSFYLFFSTCNVPPCLLEQDGKVVQGSYRTPLVIQFSKNGTQYGELGGSMFAANYSYSHEDPHDLAVLVANPGEDLEYNDDPLVLTFPQVDFTNFTFVGMASYAYVNWTIDNSEYSRPIFASLSKTS